MGGNNSSASGTTTGTEVCRESNSMKKKIEELKTELAYRNKLLIEAQTELAYRNKPLEEAEDPLEAIKEFLEDWSRLLLFLHRLFNWNKPSDPVVIFGLSTVMFVLLSYYDQTAVTTIGLLGLSISFIYLIISSVSTNRPRNTLQEKEYAQICQYFLDTRDYLTKSTDIICRNKQNRTTIHCILVLGFFVILALSGCLINDFLLTYAMVTILLLLPGFYSRVKIQ